MIKAKTSTTFYSGRYELKRIHPYKLFDSHQGLELYPPGVTSITGIFDKSAIAQWAANEAAKTALELKGSVSDDEAYETARKRYIELRDSAGGAGTSAHKWIEDFLALKVDPSYDCQNEDEANLIEAFLSFYDEHEFEWLESETILMSQMYMYLGIRDALAKKDDATWTIDFKTGNPDFEYDARTRRYTGKVRAYDAHFMQTAGYDIAAFEQEGIASDWYGIVYLIKDPVKLAKKMGIKPQKYFFFETYSIPYWQKRFLNAREAVKMNNNLNKYREI